MTPDLLRLRENQAVLMPVLERLELELVDDPAWSEPSDTSYLSEADRKNPDIAANVAAMSATNRLVAWFGKDNAGFVGLWRGAEGTQPLDASPVVRLDSEGQYSIIAASIPDYVAVSMPEDEFQSTRDALTRLGFRVSMNVDAIWDSLDGFDDPNEVRNDIYQRERAERGLGSGPDPDELEDEEEPEPLPPPVAERDDAPETLDEDEDVPLEPPPPIAKKTAPASAPAAAKKAAPPPASAKKKAPAPAPAKKKAAAPAPAKKKAAAPAPAKKKKK